MTETLEFMNQQLADRQKQLEASEAKMREEAEKQLVIPPPGQDEDLPPLRPVGAR